MELRHLRYFVAVAEEGSLTVAAERRLHTAQPSLSRQIRDLEYEVGAQLLIRSARGVELTAAGRAFLDHARLALAQVEAARGSGAAGGSAGQTDLSRSASSPGRRWTGCPKPCTSSRTNCPTSTSPSPANIRPSSPTPSHEANSTSLSCGRSRRCPTSHYKVVVHGAAGRRPAERSSPRVAQGDRARGHRRRDVHRHVEHRADAAGDHRRLSEAVRPHSSADAPDRQSRHGDVAGRLDARRGVAASLCAELPALVRDQPPLKGEPPTIDLVIGYNKANTSPILGLFLSRVDQMKKKAPQTH